VGVGTRLLVRIETKREGVEEGVMYLGEGEGSSWCPRIGWCHCCCLKWRVWGWGLGWKWEIEGVEGEEVGEGLDAHCCSGSCCCRCWTACWEGGCCCCCCCCCCLGVGRVTKVVASWVAKRVGRDCWGFPTSCQTPGSGICWEGDCLN